MKSVSTFLLAMFCTFAAFSQTNKNLNLLGKLTYPSQLSSVWGWTSPSGVDYAIVGENKFVSIVSLADPTNPVEVAQIPGPTTIWREMKTWGHYAYISLDNVGIGMQIIDLQYLPDSIKSINWAPNIPNFGTLASVHTVSMDENGIMYANGTNLGNGQALAFDVKTDPWNPTFLGAVGDYYVHDSYARGDTLWQANINNGFFTVYNVADKANPILLASQNTPNTFTHNIWPTDDNSHVFTTDEVGDSYVASYDVTDLNSIKEVNRWRQNFQPNLGIIPHNVHVKNDYIVTAHYTDGVVILDGHRPQNVIEVARYGSFTGNPGGFDGVWGVYPYFADGKILASDMTEGLFVFQPNYQRAAYLEGTVTDAANGQKINGAKIEITFSTTPDVESKASNSLGEYKTGLAGSATCSVVFSKPGYFSQTKTVAIVQGTVTILDVALSQKPSITISGKVQDAVTGGNLDGAKIRLVNADFDINLDADGGGNFVLTPFYEGTYDVYVGKWGYETKLFSTILINGANNQLLYQLNQGYKDPFALDLGWVISGTAQSGEWVRADPFEVIVSQLGGATIQSGDDIQTDIGTECYVTGNETGVPTTLVNGGITNIESPIMDLSNYLNPKIVFSSWYLAVNGQTGAPTNKKMNVRLKQNGQIKLAMSRTFDGSFLDWKSDTINVNNFFTGNDISFRIEVGSNNGGEYFEGMLDDFQVFDSPLAALEISENFAKIDVSPNPSLDQFLVKYAVDLSIKKSANMVVTNLFGAQILIKNITQDFGEINLGSDFAPGIYFVQIIADGQASKPMKLVKF
jgi:choice-of-anchor B domain-containing protein